LKVNSISRMFPSVELSIPVGEMTVYLYTLTCLTTVELTATTSLDSTAH
jgi:hypothetical protein